MLSNKERKRLANKLFLSNFELPWVDIKPFQSSALNTSTILVNCWMSQTL